MVVSIAVVVLAYVDVVDDCSVEVLVLGQTILSIQRTCSEILINSSVNFCEKIVVMPAMAPVSFNRAEPCICVEQNY